MYKNVNGKKNYERSKKIVGYEPLNESSEEIYKKLEFKSGLEVHQQLLTKKKLFCRCPGGIYQKKDEYDAEIVRHMRPTLSELGEYDGTALMEFKTKKNIIYRIKNETACTYEIDDTPPFRINDEALDISIKIALILNTNIVGELHITRKQYLDGSIPTGFQRTAIVGIEGDIPITKKKIRIIQISIEEDSCREVSDLRHNRIYTTDRLGMPLIEVVTYPDMLTPDEVGEAAQYIRYLTRSTGNVRTGIGAAREDVNVSIKGGTRVEIKGVSHIKWIPALTHNEAFRQKALLQIKEVLAHKIFNSEKWKTSVTYLSKKSIDIPYLKLNSSNNNQLKIAAINLPGFSGILSFFTQPGKTFADEISERIKVIACIAKPNMTHSEDPEKIISVKQLKKIGEDLGSEEDDAVVVIWGPHEDIKEAIETVEERCRLAFEGVPNETRKAVGKSGITVFERVLPGPNRMYPDTDSAPIAINEIRINSLRKELPGQVSEREKMMKKWKIPSDTFSYIHVKNLFPVIEEIIKKLDFPPIFTGVVIGQRLKRIEGTLSPSSNFKYSRIFELFKYVKDNQLDREIIKTMLPVLYMHPNMDFDSILTTINFRRRGKDEILSHIPLLSKKFDQITTIGDTKAKKLWVMGKLRPVATGNIPLIEISRIVTGDKNE